MAIPFKALQTYYPKVPKPKYFKLLGGEWPKLIDNPAYNNTCATRLSYALRGADVAIPKKYEEAVYGAGAPLVLKVATMGKFIQEQFGAPT